MYVSKMNNLIIINRGLMVLIFGLLLSLTAAMYFVWKSREAITVYLPPDLHQGAVIQANQPQKTTVYAFASLIYQYVNTWTDGDKDYPQKISDIRYYVSHQFHEALMDDLNRLRYRNGINELKQRRRNLGLQMDPDYRFSADSVERLSHNVWRVTLVYRLIEKVDGIDVKNALIRVPLKVVQSSADPESNQWGLVVAGYAGDIQRLEEAA